ncbi:cupin domain-containing protein [Paenibacillus psychroresistens]|uniref:Cupin domain-containing protein n=1 Tax=Paenibacillus psychroresistens TaxID=1778678 RepID=A0A6B8RSG3_9BACL|nr:cupin domain-containing protein [Paenibacillus psychroresistens]QGQ98403.1 cupin domain-containing protein [Paenibacillus psychroresistens]
MKRKKTLIIAVVVAVVVLITGGAYAYQPVSAQEEIKRTALLQHDISIPGREVIQDRVDFAPGVVSPTHSHPGEEIAYVLKGSLKYEVQGMSPVTLKAGENLFIPAGSVHRATNVGKETASELATYVVEKGKELLIIHPSTVLP